MSDTKKPQSATPITRKENGNIEIKIVIPWPDINQIYQNKIVAAVNEVEMPGFRKGKAPREMAEPTLDHSDLISKSLGELLPKAYSQIVEKNQLKPVVYPDIKIDKGKTGEDWELTAVICETPSVTLPDYRKDIPALTSKTDQSKLSTVIEYFLSHTQILIPEILVNEETNHRLSAIVDNISQIGLSLDKYLQTKKINIEELRNQTTKNARQDLEVEFILTHLQTREKLENREKTVEFIQSLLPQSK